MTIYDIATAAGVSASTVSRVINHKSGIRKETREKIEKLIEEYNYSPNVAARGLVMQSSKMIGILLVDIRVVHHIDNAFAIEQELAKRQKLGRAVVIAGLAATVAFSAVGCDLLRSKPIEPMGDLAPLPSDTQPAKVDATENMVLPTASNQNTDSTQFATAELMGVPAWEMPDTE